MFCAPPKFMNTYRSSFCLSMLKVTLTKYGNSLITGNPIGIQGQKSEKRKANINIVKGTGDNRKTSHHRDNSWAKTSPEHKSLALVHFNFVVLCKSTTQRNWLIDSNRSRTTALLCGLSPGPGDDQPLDITSEHALLRAVSATVVSKPPSSDNSQWHKRSQGGNVLLDNVSWLSSAH